MQGREQLQQVQTAEMNSPVIDDSFARLNYHQESEIGVNQQIKCGHLHLSLAIFYPMSMIMDMESDALSG